MLRILTFLSITLIFFSTSVSAEKSKSSVRVYLGGGFSTPISPEIFDQSYSVGFNGSFKLGINISNKTEMLFGLEAHHLQLNEFTASGGDLNVIMPGLDFKFSLTPESNSARGFLTAGGGLAFLITNKISFTNQMGYDLTSDGETNTKFYFQFGGGIQLNQILISLKYINIIKGLSGTSAIDNYENKRISMIPLTFAFTF